MSIKPFFDASPFTQFIMLVFCMVMCFLLFMVAGILFAPMILGIPFVELLNDVSGDVSEQNLNLLRYIQIIQGIGFFIVPAFFAAWLFSNSVTGFLHLKQTTQTKWFGATLLLMLAAIPCINLMTALNEMIVFPESLAGWEQRLRNLEDAAQKVTRLFLNVDNIGGMFFNIIMIAIIPAIGEELIFRGLLQKIFTRWTGNVHLAILITGFLFSAMHLQFYGFFPRWLLGVMFGYLLIWSGTLWLPIFAHLMNNTIAVFFSFLIHKGMMNEKIETFGANWQDIPVTAVATVICGWLLWKMYQIRKL